MKIKAVSIVISTLCLSFLASASPIPEDLEETEITSNVPIISTEPVFTINNIIQNVDSNDSKNSDNDVEPIEDDDSNIYYKRKTDAKDKHRGKGPARPDILEEIEIPLNRRNLKNPEKKAIIKRPKVGMIDEAELDPELLAPLKRAFKKGMRKTRKIAHKTNNLNRISNKKRAFKKGMRKTGKKSLVKKIRTSK